MFSSLASLIFGSNTPTTNNPESNHQQEPQDNENNITDDQSIIGNTIEVTSRTPSVAGANSASTTSINTHSGSHAGRAGKNKNKNNNKTQHHTNNNNHPRNHRSHNKKQANIVHQSPASIAKSLLTPGTPNAEDIDDELDDDWFLVEKEEEDEEYSLPRTDSEEELPLVEIKPTPIFQKKPTGSVRHPHYHQHQSHSHYSHGHHRPHLQRNRSGGALSSALSPSRCIAANDGGITQSLYVVSSSADADEHNNNRFPAIMSMEESWFLTPPPCFTSTGPANMEISPFENLLIEHPSMSVYHSIRSAQEAAESFINLDLGVVEESQQTKQKQQKKHIAQRNQQRTTQRRASGIRIDRFTSIQIKQELLARATQKSLERKERQSLCRGAIDRSNKVRDFNSKGNRQRRSDMQHCNVASRVNNNRKC